MEISPEVILYVVAIAAIVIVTGLFLGYLIFRYRSIRDQENLEKIVARRLDRRLAECRSREWIDG